MFATIKNRESSRSHTVFQVKLYSKAFGKVPSKIIAKFSLVDLAGSERLNDGEKTLDRVEEAKYINKSLSALGNVIYSLKNKHVKKKRKGLMTWTNGDKYDGEFLNNQMHGYGVYDWADGRRYEGYWVDNMMHGRGTYKGKDGSIY